jgi:hypothetical protein
MNRLAIVYLSTAALLSMGVLAGCRTQQTSQQPSPSSFLSEVISKLGKSGQACFDRGDEELCIAKTNRPLSVDDTIEPQQALMLCTRVAGQLRDCRDLRAELGLDVGYSCDQGVCHCEGVAECMLLAADCGGGGTCGSCAIGECCCPESAVMGPPVGAHPLNEMP